MRKTLTLFLLLATLAPATQAASPGCDKCADLPMLYRELLDQEFLRSKFKSWADQEYYPVSLEKMQSSAQASFDQAREANSFYGVLTPAPPPPGTPKPKSAPTLGVDVDTSACRLMLYEKGADGKDIARPTTPQQVKGRFCAPVADYMLAHEEVHQRWCEAGWKAGKQAELKRVESFVRDDVKAYQEGIAHLRQYIARLATQCGWGGSTRPVKPDGTKTVPVPADILKLSNTLRRGSDQRPLDFQLR